MPSFLENIKDKIFPGNNYGDEYYDSDAGDDYEDDYEETPAPRPVSSRRTTSSRYGSNSKVYRVNTNVQMEVLVSTPTSVEEAGEACDALRDKKTVVVNLQKVNFDTAQRISDFLSGASYVLDGNLQLISDEILIVGPMNVDITGNFADELQANGINIPRTASTKWR
ncbi:MAG: cell division protein SepF [Clostridiales bacterium]|nr:cell division protein SepF [Clostridiales bacterium]MCD8216274.1 cell division protein SepF [Clostridiales bacterium]